MKAAPRKPQAPPDRDEDDDEDEDEDPDLSFIDKIRHDSDLPDEPEPDDPEPEEPARDPERKNEDLVPEDGADERKVEPEPHPRR
jgi:hypothetical protein